MLACLFVCAPKTIDNYSHEIKPTDCSYVIGMTVSVAFMFMTFILSYKIDFSSCIILVDPVMQESIMSRALIISGVLAKLL